MRRFISTMLMFVLCLYTVLTVMPHQEMEISAEEVKGDAQLYAATSEATGDVDGSGTVDAEDALLVLRFTARLVTLQEENLAAANVDQNEIIDVNDARFILMYAAGTIDEYPTDGDDSSFNTTYVATVSYADGRATIIVYADEIGSADISVIYQAEATAKAAVLEPEFVRILSEKADSDEPCRWMSVSNLSAVDSFGNTCATIKFIGFVEGSGAPVTVNGPAFRFVFDCPPGTAFTLVRRVKGFEEILADILIDNPSSQPDDPVTDRLYGDINADMVIDADDALMILKIAAKIDDATADQKVAGDVDDSGTLDADDALFVLKKAAKLIEFFPIEEKTL